MPKAPPPTFYSRFPASKTCAGARNWTFRRDRLITRAAATEGGLPDDERTTPVDANNASQDMLYDLRDGIGWVTFNRPQARNAFTFAMYERLAQICEEA